MYSLDFLVTTSCCDEYGRLKLYSALQMMQDCSEMWIDSEPVVKDYFKRSHMAQLLASRQVEILRMPQYRDRLHVETSVWEMKSMFGFRNTFIYDEAGRVCYRSWSQGAFVDSNTGHLAAVPDDIIASLHLDARKEMTYLGRHITLPEEKMYERPDVYVTNNDIDYNRHMNNANYVRIALEYLPQGFQPTGMRVEYKLPCRSGDCITPRSGLDRDRFYVELSRRCRVCTVVEFTEQPVSVSGI